MKRFCWTLSLVILGTTFWIPSIIVHALRGREFGGSRIDILLVTLLPVIAAVLTLEITSRLRAASFTRSSVALSMLLGIWFFGPLCSTTSATFSGAGFLSSVSWPALISAFVLFVPYTFIMSTYDGTLGALVIVTGLFLMVAAVGIVRRFRSDATNPG